MAEGTSLLRTHTGNCIEGSNPSLSATNILRPPRVNLVANRQEYLYIATPATIRTRSSAG